MSRVYKEGGYYSRESDVRGEMIMATPPESTARLPERTKEDLPADQQHIFDEIAGSRGAVRGPFAMLLHSPEVAGRTIRSLGVELA